MSCVLRAYGANFDVDSFLKDCLLEPEIVYHRGKPRFPNSSRRLDEVSGMNISVSTCEFSDLRGQIDDAIQFLSDNDQGLQCLRDFPGFEEMELDFPIEERDVAVQSDAFPPQLLSLLGALRIGLVVSRYPVSDDPQAEYSNGVWPQIRRAPHA